MRRAYLDHSASSPVKPAVRAAMLEALEAGGNPSSVHTEGRAARRRLEDARAAVAALVGAAPSRIVLTSGGTEANALALRGFPARRPVVSAVEHDSVLANAPAAPRIPVDGDGVVDPDALDRTLAGMPAPALVSVMLVNNETGVIQPVAEIARLVHGRGALLHVDAVQGAGRLTLDMRALGADLLTLSAHKIGGPPGVGALVLADGLDPDPLLHGGGQERRRRAGTENLPGIVGFGVAAGLAGADVERAADLAALRDGLEAAVRRACPTVRIMGAGAPRVASLACLALPGVPGETQVMALDLAGIAVSAGAACSSGKVTPSHVLAAMGADAATAASAIRVSLGWSTTAADLERFIAAWTGMAHRLVRAA